MNKKVITFDCYGTLIDWERGIIQSLKPIFSKLNIHLSDEEILKSFSSVENEVQSAFPTILYSDVLSKVLINLCQKLDISIADSDTKTFGNSIGGWMPFEDTNEALLKLSSKYKLIIVSNIDNHSIDQTLKHFNVKMYKIFTAQNIGAYKPDLNVFKHVFDDLEREGILKNDILHVAESLFHDHVAAKKLGLDSVWIKRRHDNQGTGATPKVDDEWIPELKFQTLIEFADYIVDY